MIVGDVRVLVAHMGHFYELDLFGCVDALLFLPVGGVFVLAVADCLFVEQRGSVVGFDTAFAIFFLPSRAVIFVGSRRRIVKSSLGWCPGCLLYLSHGRVVLCISEEDVQRSLFLLHV